MKNLKVVLSIRLHLAGYKHPELYRLTKEAEDTSRARDHKSYAVSSRLQNTDRWSMFRFLVNFETTQSPLSYPRRRPC